MMGEMLRTCIFEVEKYIKKEIAKMLRSIQWALNSSVKSETSFSSGQMIFSPDMVMYKAIKEN